LLTDDKILEACRSYQYQFRRRVFGPIATVLHFVAQALQRESSFLATWQELMTPVAARDVAIAAKHFDPSSLAYARRRIPVEVLEHLARDACHTSTTLSHTRWRGFRLMALDSTTVSMPREDELFKHFGAHKARTTTVRYPLGTMACLVRVSDSLIVDYRFGKFDPGETTTAMPLFQHLGSGDLLLVDRHYSGGPCMAQIYATGADFLIRKNARRLVDRLPVIEQLGKDDFITDVPMGKVALKNNPALPTEVRVRVFKARWTSPAGEKVTEWFMTSLTDSRRYPKKTLANLYHEFKCTLHADVLRSKTVDNIRKELAAHVLAYQIIRQLIHQAAEQHDCAPTEISFLNAARWIVHFSHYMGAAPTRELPTLYDALLDAIATSLVDVRPGRLEPRALTREWKHYPHLRISRAEWRQKRLRQTA
jgi:hypothetical protein